jgi:hypothetical protein
MRPKTRTRADEDVSDTIGVQFQGSHHRRHTQIDLPENKVSGLIEIREFSRGLRIGVCLLLGRDVVRHPLVQDIIKAYERTEEKPPPTGTID